MRVWLWTDQWFLPSRMGKPRGGGEQETDRQRSGVPGSSAMLSLWLRPLITTPAEPKKPPQPLAFPTFPRRRRAGSMASTQSVTLRSLSLLCICLSVSEGGGEGSGGDDDPVVVASHFSAMAKAYEARGDRVNAIRAFETARRVHPSDARHTRAIARIAGSALGSVLVRHGDDEHRMLVWRPPPPANGMQSDPTAAGGANDQVKGFFSWKRLPTHDWSAIRCCGFSHKGRGGVVTMVLGLTCLSPLFLMAHNAAQSLILGGTPSPIPTSSNATCGMPCGSRVPPPPSSLPPAPSYPAPGHDLEGLLLRRRALLSQLGPYVHRSQLIGDPLAASAGIGGEEEAVGLASAVSTHPGGGDAGGLRWDVEANRVLPEEPDPDAQAAQRWIEARQNGPEECSSRRAIVYRNDRAYWGFAANVQFMTVLLQHALAFGRTFISASPDHWNYAGQDCRMGWECYFLPPSRCAEMDVWQPYTLDLRADYRWDYRGMLYHLDTLDAKVLYYANVDGPWQEVYGHLKTPGEGIEAREWIPLEFRHRGLLWWRAQLTRYLLRPKRFVLDYIGRRMKQLNMSQAMSPGLVAMHVRRGDKAYDSYQGSYFGSIEPYIDKARRIAGGGLRALFVCTDDPQIVEELSMTAAKHRVEALIDRDERRYNGTHIHAPVGISLALWPAFPGDDPKVNTTVYALDTIKSVWMLAFAAPAFVGTVTSSMSRLVYQLRVAFGQPELGDEWTVDQDKRHPPGWFADP